MPRAPSGALNFCIEGSVLQLDALNVKESVNVSVTVSHGRLVPIRMNPNCHALKKTYLEHPDFRYTTLQLEILTKVHKVTKPLKMGHWGKNLATVREVRFV
jgi:hypothetical protein